MSVHQYIDKIKFIQNQIIQYIDSEESVEEYFVNVVRSINDNQIQKSRYDMKIILYFLLALSNNHHRYYDFFSKIEKIILYMKEEIIDSITGHELFDIFESNKRVLLFLFN